MGVLPWERVLHKTLQCESFPEAAFPQELLRYRCFSWIRSSGVIWSSPWATAPARTQLLNELSMGFSFLQGISGCCVLHGEHCFFPRYLLSCCFHGPWSNNLLHHDLPLGLQGSVCSWSAASISIFPDFGVCKAASLPHSHSSLPAALAKHFSPFLKYVIPEVLSASLVVSAATSGSTLFELTGIYSV